MSPRIQRNTDGCVYDLQVEALVCKKVGMYLFGLYNIDILKERFSPQREFEIPSIFNNGEI